MFEHPPPASCACVFNLYWERNINWVQGLGDSLWVGGVGGLYNNAISVETV
jgi:hypothetical protein